jgi:enoyl-CoA hydratase
MRSCSFRSTLGKNARRKIWAGVDNVSVGDHVLREAAVRSSNILLEKHPDVVVVRLNRGPVNAFTQDMFTELTRIFDMLHSDSRPIVIVGAQATFSAGFDVKAMRDRNADAELATTLAERCLRVVEQHPTPVVAAAERLAIGFGFLLAATADLLVTSDVTRFGMPEARLGMVSDVRPLQRYLSYSWIRRLSLFGEILTADEMHLEGAGVVVCSPGSVEHTAVDLAAGLSICDAEVLRDTKRHIASVCADVRAPHLRPTMHPK